MIVGKVVGKTTTNSFKFTISKEVYKYDYVQIWHEKYGYVMCQIIEIEFYEAKSIAKCIILGYIDNGILKNIKSPIKPKSEVLKASEEEVQKFLKVNENGLYLGLLRDTSIKIKLDFEKLITKHLAILAKTGAGKSYTVGVILEELIEKGIPVVIIDVHGEYNTLTESNDDEKELESMLKFEVKPTEYAGKIRHYGNTKYTNALPLALKDKFDQKQLLSILPKLNATQKGTLFESIRGMTEISLKEILFSLNQLETNKKWSLISLIEEIINSDVFLEHGIQYNELVQPNRLSIIDLKGYNPRIQEVITYKLLSDLFELRKINQIPPVFIVIEEAHNFCPERNFGEKITSEIIRTIASEGRKFGMGLGVISQRPSRIDKNVLSQCNTQIIMKVTNPNDLKSIVQSVEGIYEGADEEIKNLPVGYALVTGVVDVPLIVEIRTRKTKHGGKTQKIMEAVKVSNEIQAFKEKEILPIIKPNMSENDVKIINNTTKIKKELIPIVIFECEDQTKYRIMFELINGEVITDIDEFKTKKLPNLTTLSMKEIKVLEKAFILKEFNFDQIYEQAKILDLSKVLTQLIKKEFIIETSNIKLDPLKKNKTSNNNHLKTYKLNDCIILSELSEFEIMKEFQYIELQYDQKLDEKASVDKIKQQLQNYTKILNHQTGFLLHYVPIK